MNDRQARWHNRLNRLYLDSPSEPAEPIILNEAMISQWLQEHRANYPDATETIKACLRNFGLRRRHRELVWNVYSRTDFSHLKSRGS